MTRWLPGTDLKRYGLVVLAFLHIAVSRGLHGTFGVFFVAMIEAFGWSRGATAGAISLAIVFEGLCLPFAGGLIDRIGGRRTLILGGSILAFGLALSSTIASLWQFYFWVGIVTSAGIALIGMVPHVAILSREFPRRRGTALGVAWAGGGVGIVLLVPVAQLMIDRWGWPIAYIGLGILTLAMVIPPVQFLLPAAASDGSNPGPASAAPAGERPASASDWTVKRALSNPAFWLLFVARTLASMGNQIIVTHQIAHAVDVGFASVFAASIFGLMGVISVFGRMLFGYLADVMRREIVFTWVQVVSAIGIAALLLLRDDSMAWLLYVYAVCYGLGQGSRALVLSAISADIFHGKHFGAIFGYFTFSIGLGGAAGAWLGGYLFDVTRSYTAPFWVSFGCLLVSVFVVLASSRIVKAQKNA